jgi:multidrug efflux pump subunit AcrB
VLLALLLSPAHCAYTKTNQDEEHIQERLLKREVNAGARGKDILSNLCWRSAVVLMMMMMIKFSTDIS